MNLIRNFLLISAMTATATLFSTQAVAEGRGDGPKISRDEAAKIARDRFNGKLLDIRPQGRGANADYRVKVLREGRVQVFSIDGNTGKVEK